MDQSFDSQWLKELDATAHEEIRHWATTSKRLQRPPPAYGSSNYDSLANAIQDDINLVEEAVRRITRNRAIMSRVRGLPSEILLIIFGFVGPFWFPGPDDAVQLFRLASVCRKWRQCILTTPSFWSYVLVGQHDHMLPTWELFEMWQERAGTTCPLHVIISDDEGILIECQEYLESNASRIASIQVLTEIGLSNYRFLEELIIGASESLVELTFSGMTAPTFSRGFKITLAKLKYLEAVDVLPYLDIQAPSLREIAIRGELSRSLPKRFLTSLCGMSSQLISISLEGVEAPDDLELLPTTKFTLPHLVSLQWTKVTHASRYRIPLYILSHAGNLTTLHIGLSFLAVSLPLCKSLTDLTLAYENPNPARPEASDFLVFNPEQVAANFGRLPSLKIIEVPIYNKHFPKLQDFAIFIMNLLAEGRIQNQCRSLEVFRCDCGSNSHTGTVGAKNGRALLSAIESAVITKPGKPEKGEAVVTFKHTGTHHPWNKITWRSLSPAQFKVVVEHLSDKKVIVAKPEHLRFSQ